MARPDGCATISSVEPDRPITSAGLGLLVLLGALGLALRLVGAADLPWASGEAGATPLAARTLALAAGTAAVPLAFLLHQRMGATAALVLALLIATSPWHVHASRVAGPATCAFLGMTLACGWFGVGGNAAGAEASATAKDRVRLALFVGAIALGFTMPATARRATGPGLVTLLAGDVGVVVPLLALLQFARAGRWRRLLDAALLGCFGSLLTARFGFTVDLLAWFLPPLFLAAAALVARFIAAAASLQARLAFALLAVVPTLPSLVSEQIDGGRFDLGALAGEFARARHGGEPLYASDPGLAARAFQVEARPLAALPAAPDDRDAFVLLLLDRGRILGGETLPADLESKFDLLARSGRKRLDLGRFEARLYRRPEAASR